MRMEKKYPPSLYLKRLMRTLPPAATSERRRELCKLLPASRDELIETAMGFAVSLVERFVTPACEHLREDMQGAAFQGLVEAVNRLTPASTGPTSLIQYWVRRRVREVVESELACSEEESRKHKRKKRDAVDAIPDDMVGVRDSVCDPVAILELRDTIEFACGDEIDRALVAAFERGESVSEVAATLGINHHEVRSRRANVFARFQSLNARE